MKRWIGAVALAVLLVGQAQADVYKCEVDGKTTYQGTPCSAEGSGVVPLRGVSGLGSSGGTFSGSSSFAPPSDDASTMQKFRMLMSTLEVIKLKADDCDWALKVRRDISGCQASLRPSPASTRLRSTTCPSMPRSLRMAWVPSGSTR